LYVDAAASFGSRTAADYETLRQHIIEGTGACSGIENEIAAFISQGVTVWIRQFRPIQGVQHMQRAKPASESAGEYLTILLANIIEG